MVGAPDVVQPWMPRAARESDACLWHLSLVGGARRRGCAAAGVSLFFNGPPRSPLPARGAEPGLTREDDRLRPAGDLQLGEDVRDVVADGLVAEIQRGGDRLVVAPLGD